ncbi:MAG: hypothetical protein Q8N48_02585 [Thiobacillus sp.]|nr:hypothetical protein [Thiobacillus sp.]MDP2977696.1 hypothetical protein [Thiobacillus sp.]
MTARAPILLAERFAAGEPPTAATLGWLRTSIQRILRGDAPADVCLRLTMACRKAARNDALIRAARIVDAGRGLSAWHLAELVRQAVNRFETVTLPRIRRGDAGELSPLDSELRDAFATGAPPLTTQHRIYDVLASCPSDESAT